MNTENGVKEEASAPEGILELMKNKSYIRYFILNYCCRNHIEANV